MARLIKIVVSISILFLLSSFKVVDNNNNCNSEVGKVLLIIGPQSSGKTAFVTKILESSNQYKTIDRQKIIYETMQECYADLFAEVEFITGIKIKSLLHYNSIVLDSLNPDVRNKFIQLKEKYRNVINERLKEFFKKVFIKYNESIRLNTSNGYITILDESMIRSNDDFDLFLSCCKGIEVKRVLLFNTLEEILEKCMIRNRKFLKFFDSNKDIKNAITQMENEAIKTGGSQESYRLPHNIIRDYKEAYKFTTSENANNVILSTLTKEKAKKVLTRINNEQLKLLNILGNNIASTTINSNFVENELQQIFRSANTVNITSKIKFDYVIKASEISNLSNTKNLKKHLEKILELFSTSKCL